MLLCDALLDSVMLCWTLLSSPLERGRAPLLSSYERGESTVLLLSGERERGVHTSATSGMLLSWTLCCSLTLSSPPLSREGEPSSSGERREERALCSSSQRRGREERQSSGILCRTGAGGRGGRRASCQEQEQEEQEAPEEGRGGEGAREREEGEEALTRELLSALESPPLSDPLLWREGLSRCVLCGAPRSPL
jgi:hypothetical protein